jgi:DNA-binding NtrC family response regulator
VDHLARTADGERVLRALVVEDEELVSMLTEGMLQDLGFAIGGIAATLEDGLKLARDEDFDLALVDVNLNSHVAEPIAKYLLDHGIPFVFVTGYSQASAASAFARVPVLRKPFTAAQMEDAVRRALNTSDSRR